MFEVFEAKARAANMSVTPVTLLALDKKADYSGRHASTGKTRRRYAPEQRQHRAALAVVRATLAMVIVVCMVSFVSGPCVFATSLYWSYVRPSIAEWWGVHDEMIDATFLALVGVVPLAITAVGTELLRRLKRARSRRRRHHWVMAVSSQLRRRPHFLAGRWVCWLSYGELLFLLALLGVNAIIFWHNYARKYASLLARQPSAAFPRVKTFGRSMGYNCIFNMVFLFLPTSRDSAWMEFFNVSYANAIRYHRWLGVLSVTTAVVHCGCYYWCWVRAGEWQQRALPCWDCSWVNHVGRQVWVNVFGELALGCFILISVTSLPVVRRRLFDVFYSVHHLFLAAVAFTVLHWESAAWFLLPSLVMYLASRAISHRNVFGAVPVKVLQIAMIGDNICKIVLARDAQYGNFDAGQFVYLNLPMLSRLQWHPFTIASSSADPTMTIMVKALGDWTTRFVQHVHDCKSRQIPPMVHVDGYYGASLRAAAQPYTRLVVVGGGIGVTPLLSLLEDIAMDCTAVTQIDSDQPEIHFIFCFREVQLLVEITPILRRLARSNVHFRASLFWTRATPAASGSPSSRMAFTNVWSDYPSRMPETIARPFAPALVPSQKVFAGLAALVTATLMLAVLEYNWGTSSASWWIFSGTHVWVVRRSAQLSALFFGVAAVHVFGACSRIGVSTSSASRARSALMQRQYGGIEDIGDRLCERLLPSRPEDMSVLHPLREARVDSVLEEFGVRIGEHPDLARLLYSERQHAAPFCTDLPDFGDYRRRQALAGGCLSSPVGVFVSGPGSLKTAVHRAVAAIGSSEFDVHTEEFEL